MVLSSAGTTYAVSSSQARFVLEDSFGYRYSLNLAFGVILYGEQETLGWPTLGWIRGKEMVLWVNGPGTEENVDSYAYVGKWQRFDTSWIFIGTWISFKFPDKYGYGDVQMVPVGMSGGKIKTEQYMSLTSGDLTVDTYCFMDSFGYKWALDLHFGVIYHGLVNCLGQVWPAFGFTVDDEMFLWANAPEDSGYVDFVYTGKQDSVKLVYRGAWCNYPGPMHGLVQWWPCVT